MVQGGMARVRRSSDPALCPLPAVGGYRIVPSAAIRRPITYSGSSGVFTVTEDGSSEEVGPVPRLAIGLPLWQKRDIAIRHCTRTWEVVGIQSGFKSVRQAEACAERMYPGVSDAWIVTGVSIRDAKEFERVVWHRFQCSFCSRIPPEQPTATLIDGKDARICGACIHNLYRQLES